MSLTEGDGFVCEYFETDPGSADDYQAGIDTKSQRRTSF
jgi:hypothetical protein